MDDAFALHGADVTPLQTETHAGSRRLQAGSCARRIGAWRTSGHRMAGRVGAAIARRIGHFLGILIALTVAGCAEPPESIPIGFIGRFARDNLDLTLGTRNGAQLAIDRFNSAGGLHGRPLELVLADETDSSLEQIVAEFRRRGVEFVIGPLTSEAAERVVALPEAASLVFFSPTATSPRLAGLRDNLFRPIETTDTHTDALAARLLALGLRRAAVIKEITNLAYSNNWASGFEQAFAARGGTLVSSDYFSSDDVDALTAHARSIVDSAVDVAVVVGRPLDVARLAQRMRAIDPTGPAIASAERGSGEQLFELGGRAIEGMLVQHILDPDVQSAHFDHFARDYLDHFRQAPGVTAALGFESASAVITALQAREKGESALQAMRRVDDFPGVQQTLRLDAFGETARPIFLCRVEGGRFVRVD